MSIDFLIPDDVISYIYEHNLYRDLDMPDSKGKEKALTNDPDAGTSTG
jgi:nicotinamide mononucleotide adenylyltransferase